MKLLFYIWNEKTIKAKFIAKDNIEGFQSRNFEVIVTSWFVECLHVVDFRMKTTAAGSGDHRTWFSLPKNFKN